MNFSKTIIYRDFSITLSLRTVLEGMGCQPGTPSFRIAQHRFPQLWQVFQTQIRPFAALRRDPAGGPGRLLCLLSLGLRYPLQLPEPSGLLDGLVLDAMAAEYLFAMDGRVLQKVRGKGCPFGVTRRLEFLRDFSPEEGKRMLSCLDEDHRLGVAFNNSGVLTPEKSVLYALELSDDPAVFHASHNCDDCPAAEQCTHRKGRAP